MPALSQRITTYQFPETYQIGNWLMFNIYVHEESKFNTKTDRDPAFNYDVEERPGETEEERLQRISGQGGGPIRSFANHSIVYLLENSRSTQHLKISTVLGIYLPENISFDYNVEWGAEQMGTLRSIMNAAGEARQGAINTLSNEISVDSLKAQAMSAGQFSAGASHIAMRKAAASLGQMVGIPLEQAFDKHQKKTLNNHTELHFSGVNLRSFAFKFKFYPKTAHEAQQIDSIIKVFKFHMYPELVDTVGSYMLYPAEFEIQYMRGWDVDGQAASSRNKNVAKIARCALRNCKINHGEGEYVPIKGPNFAHDPNDWYNSYTEMELSFNELTQLTKKDIVAGY